MSVKCLMHRRGWFWESPGQSEIPTCRPLATISQTLCCENSQMFSQSPCLLLGSCLQRSAGEFLDQHRNLMTVCWAGTEVWPWYTATQLQPHYRLELHSCINYNLNSIHLVLQDSMEKTFGKKFWQIQWGKHMIDAPPNSQNSNSGVWLGHTEH